METSNTSKIKMLEYSIHKYSSFSSTYVPENIKINKYNDESSRWTSNSNKPPQFLTLKLKQLAIVKTISFGKFEQTHICNLKRFKVFGGIEENTMLELFEGGLKNDNISETFTLRHTLGLGNFPLRFIQIMPLLSWGSSFYFSIWFIELKGDDDPVAVEAGLQHFNYYREKEVIRLCLKHFRQQNYSKTLKALEEETGIQLEDPYISRLHEILVEQANYDSVEKFIEQAIDDGYFDNYIALQEYQANWRPVGGDVGIRPGMRGGHQMCVDPLAEKIYLFGGWDGRQDLSDLWVYSIAACQWTLLCVEAQLEGGPTPRSCHKMCLDTNRKQIFTLGRYLDTENRTTETLKSDFYVYDIESKSWMQITADTGVMGGPQLIYDHQMCIDIEKRTLYVFGGRILIANTGDGISEAPYSGLYSYQVSTNTWTQLLEDGVSQNGCSVIHSRVGHSMLFHSQNRKLYIFGGQRNKEYLNDFFTYDVDTKQVMFEEYHNNSSSTTPPPGFTQRATIDADRDEIYVLSGLSKEKEKRDENIQNSFWVYNICERIWKCVYRNEHAGEVYWKKMQYIEPCPRFAHQLVYDYIKKTHYLFGGNPGRIVTSQLRLDDFWELKLYKPGPSQLLRECRLLIRKYQFREMASTDSIAALSYLQTSLSEVIDHSDPQQEKQFQLLASELFNDKNDTPFSLCSGNNLMERTNSSRKQLFEQLMAFFPESVRQPNGNLYNLLKL